MNGDLPVNDIVWHVSSYSDGGGGNCVEAGPIRDGSARVAIRDSTRRHAGAFTTGRASWSVFVAWAARRD